MNKTIDLEFEAWARKMSMDLEYRNIPGVGQFYECPRTLLALEAWQASRAHESELLSALIAITNSGPDAIPIKEAFEMAHRAIERATGDKA